MYFYGLEGKAVEYVAERRALAVVLREPFARYFVSVKLNKTCSECVIIIRSNNKSLKHEVYDYNARGTGH